VPRCVDGGEEFIWVAKPVKEGQRDGEEDAAEGGQSRYWVSESVLGASRLRTARPRYTRDMGIPEGEGLGSAPRAPAQGQPRARSRTSTGWRRPTAW
jgi:hypothetical protein